LLRARLKSARRRSRLPVRRCFACLHNVFVILDHGTQLSDEFLLFLVDEEGNELTPGALHEDFAEHLSETGRYR
jgi:hypothetical protein